MAGSSNQRPVRALAFAAGLAFAIPAYAQAACANDVEAAVVTRLRAQRYLDAHALAETLQVVCAGELEMPRLQLLDALALEQLDEGVRARDLLSRLAHSDDSTRSPAAVLLARSQERIRDQPAFAAALLGLPALERHRLRLWALRDDDDAFHEESARPDVPRSLLWENEQSLYAHAMRTRRPWLAGTLSAVVPGLGQAYAGSWSGAAVSFVLNAVLIGATVELAAHSLYVSAAAAGLGASFFYVGGIIDAVDLARRRGEMAAEPHRAALERALIPEAFP